MLSRHFVRRTENSSAALHNHYASSRGKQFVWKPEMHEGACSCPEHTSVRFPNTSPIVARDERGNML